MIFKIISNPPYSIAEKILSSLKDKYNSIWLVPFSNFKSFENFKNIKIVERVDNYFDADLLQDIVIAETDKTKRDLNYDILKIDYIYNPAYAEIYKHNYKYRNKYIKYISDKVCNTEQEMYDYIPNDQENIIAFPKRYFDNFKSKNSNVYKYNHGLENKYCLKVSSKNSVKKYRMYELLYKVIGKKNFQNGQK